MIDKFLDWQWSSFALLWVGGVAVMLATVLTGVAGASWLLTIATLAIELGLLVGVTAWAIRYRRGWDDEHN